MSNIPFPSRANRLGEGFILHFYFWHLFNNSNKSI